MGPCDVTPIRPQVHQGVARNDPRSRGKSHFVSSVEPRDNTAPGARLFSTRTTLVLSKDHKSAERSLSLERLTLSPEARNGELAKNSARVPMRFVLRSHSSAETTTTALRPLRMIFCGPRVTWEPWACSNPVQRSFQSRARESDRATRVC